MIQKRQATVDDLYRVEGKAELVDGELVLMSPAGRGHGRVSLRISHSLLDHEADHGGGVAFGDNVGFLVNLPRRKSFSPDAAWLAGVAEDDLDSRFVGGPPTFAVEIRSPADNSPAGERAIKKKIADYFAAGTLVVWDIDLLSDDVIRCYRAHSPGEGIVYRRGMVADAEPAVVGWRFPVDSLFRGKR